MNFKKDAETVYTSEPWYDLFEGGYIDPDDLLEEADAKEVKAAIQTMKQFLGQAEQEGLIEIG